MGGCANRSADSDSELAKIGQAACGDLLIDSSETCDDGNTIDGDGCNANCQVELAWSCSATAPSVCTKICADGNWVSYGVGEYFYCKSLTKFADAASACEFLDGAASGWFLTTVDNDVENTELRLLSTARHWIGYNDQAVESVFVWQSGASSTFTKWGPGQPNGGADNDCTAIEGDGRWYDHQCNFYYGYVCEGPSLCGNLTRGVGEACDDGNTTAGDGCDAVCALEVPAVCGNGKVEDAERCDDGNLRDFDGCSVSCQVQPLYVCSGQPSVCKSSILCGDGKIEGMEVCDDSNAASGDGCSSTCKLEDGYTCTGAPSFCERNPVVTVTSNNQDMIVTGSNRPLSAPVGQSFVVTNTTLTAVDICASAAWTRDGVWDKGEYPQTATLYRGEGTEQPLGGVSVEVLDETCSTWRGGPWKWIRARFNAPVIAGGIYSVRFAVAGEGFYTLARDTRNPYAQGKLLTPLATIDTSLASSDLLLRFTTR